MDLVKQYIIQCIVEASNNLRLSSEKIEAVAILKERLNSSSSLNEEFKNFKKITELSKLGIKLGELLQFIESGKVNFLKLSEQFKEHSSGLVKELTYVLDIVTPQMMRTIFQKREENSINVDLTNKNTTTVADEKLNSALAKEIKIPKRSGADELKESIIFEELNKDEEKFSFEKYEARVLNPIKSLDMFLNRVQKFDFTEMEMNANIKIMKDNAEYSQKVGFDIIANMHKIFAKGLELIKQKKIAPSTNIIESLRACLIVIVAVVRGKEVDITNYLNRAESFGRTILLTKRTG